MAFVRLRPGRTKERRECGTQEPEMSQYSDEDYTLTETQCEERCDELRSQLDEANKIIESLGQESDHFCKQADKLRSQVARLERELELSDQLVDVLRRTEGALYECGCESCEATIQEICAALAQHAAMRAKESNSKAEQSHPQSRTTF